MSIEITDCLRSLGLEQYEPAFRANDVDAEVLSKLTAEDLISIGVTSVGHRRKLLQAIAALGGELPNPPSQSDVAAPADAERRQLTMMFCDLVGFTPLSSRLDPEDYREIITQYHRTVAATIGKFDGFVAKYMGDGILVYFGYPQAHEDDAERAIRAGLESIAMVSQLDMEAAELGFQERRQFNSQLHSSATGSRAASASNIGDRRGQLYPEISPASGRRTTRGAPGRHPIARRRNLGRAGSAQRLAGADPLCAARAQRHEVGQPQARLDRTTGSSASGPVPARAAAGHRVR